jgi:hypothetical protein
LRRRYLRRSEPHDEAGNDRDLLRGRLSHSMILEK